MKIEKKNLFTFSELSEKEKRNLDILALVAKKGLISRTELSKETGINIVSISNYIKHHIEKKLVFDAGLDVSTGGRKPELVEINNQDNCVIGVDIGPDRIQVVLTDLAVKTIGRISIPRERSKSNKKLASDIASTIKKLMSDHSVHAPSLRSIGVSVTDENLMPIARELESHAGVFVFTGKKAICAAFAEKQLNKSANTDAILYMHSDLGEGVVILKDVFLSSGDNEDTDLRESTRYLRPWNDELGIATSARKEVTKGIGTEIVKLSGASADNITEEVVINAAKQNDEVALIIMQNVGINLGLRISYLVNLFGPKVVVIGGGVETAGDILLGTVIKMVDKLAFAKYAKAVSIIPGVLGPDAPSLGAAALAIREIFLNA